MIKMNLEPKEVEIKNLLLDPNNPRFFDIEDWQKVQSSLYHLDKVQNKAYRIIESTQVGRINDLKKSIESNGYIPTEMIVVKPYDHEDGKYVIIEGNRRVTAIKSIIENNIDPEDQLANSLKKLEVLVYKGTGDEEEDELNEMILQGIRHIGGPKEWGAYQKANLVAKLKEEKDLLWTEIGDRIGLGSIKTARLFRAYKALNQMKNDEEFGDFADLKLFSLFDEALIPPLKEWLGWSDDNYQFNNENNRKAFYRLIVGDPVDNLDPVITNPQKMRNFRKLINTGKKIILSRFLSGEINIDQAIRAAEPDPVQVTIREAAENFISELNDLPAQKLKDLEDDEVELLKKVVNEVNDLLSMYEKLK